MELKLHGLQVRTCGLSEICSGTAGKGGSPSSVASPHPEVRVMGASAFLSCPISSAESSSCGGVAEPAITRQYGNLAS